MRGAIIGDDHRLHTDMGIYQKRLQQTLLYDVINDSLDSKDEDILTLLTAGFYTWVMFRLSLAGFVALRIGEIAHKVRSPVRLILNSETDIPRPVLLKLFDFLNPGDDPGDGEESQEYLEHAFASGGMPRRLTSSKAINEAITSILEQATCFDTHERKLVKEQPSRHTSESLIGWKEVRIDIHPTFADYRRSWGEAPVSVSPTNKEQKVRTILFLAANPKATPPIRLAEEIKRIEQGLERSKKRDQFKLVPKWAVTDDDLLAVPYWITNPRSSISADMAAEQTVWSSRMTTAKFRRSLVTP